MLAIVPALLLIDILILNYERDIKALKRNLFLRMIQAKRLSIFSQLEGVAFAGEHGPRLHHLQVNVTDLHRVLVIQQMI